MSYDYVSLHPPYRQIFDCNNLVYQVGNSLVEYYNKRKSFQNVRRTIWLEWMI